MPSSHRSAFRPSLTPSLPFVLLVILLATLWLAGGASRPDLLGQVVVRSVSWILLIIAVLFGPRPSFSDAKAVLLLLIAAAALVLVQLVPLPPGLWQALPGRAVLAEAALASGQAQPWRPWSIVPDATVNAASSLVVPFATLLLLLQLKEAERQSLPGLMLLLVAASMLVGLLQFSGVVLDNIFINDDPGEVAGTFANRNHFALFMAMGCLLAPAWASISHRRSHWPLVIAWALILLFLLMILASGSRAGVGVGILALLLGMTMSARDMKQALARYPRWAFPALIAGILGVIALFILFSFLAGRAVSIDRILAVGEDMRGRGLPVVLAAIGHYFPFGAGLGGFDPVFRMHEPFGLLKLTVFNHAHNDFLEVALGAGAAGILLLVAAIAWWAWASIRVLRAGLKRDQMLARLGSAMLFLVIIASIVDYPARTPMIMAMIAIASLLLGGHFPRRTSSALPESD